MANAAEETGLLDRVKKQKDSPVQRPLKELMEIDLVVNEKSQVWICHDKPLPHGVDWVEYDVDLGTVTLVGRGGVMYDYGEIIRPELRTYLKKATFAYVIYMKDGDMQDMREVKVVTRRLDS